MMAHTIKRTSNSFNGARDRISSGGGNLEKNKKYILYKTLCINCILCHKSGIM